MGQNQETLERLGEIVSARVGREYRIVETSEQHVADFEARLAKCRRANQKRDRRHPRWMPNALPIGAARRDCRTCHGRNRVDLLVSVPGRRVAVAIQCACSYRVIGEEAGKPITVPRLRRRLLDCGVPPTPGASAYLSPGPTGRPSRSARRKAALARRVELARRYGWDVMLWCWGFRTAPAGAPVVRRRRFGARVLAWLTGLFPSRGARPVPA